MIKPNLPPQSMKTYGIIVPRRAFRKATCAEVQCRAYTNGWETFVVEGDNDIGDRQAHYIRKLSGRKFAERKREDGATVFKFESGQTCFREHVKRREEVPEIYVVRGGDWRGNPRGDSFRHVNGADWVDDFANHQNKLATRLEQG